METFVWKWRLRKGQKECWLLNTWGTDQDLTTMFLNPKVMSGVNDQQHESLPSFSVSEGWQPKLSVTSKSNLSLWSQSTVVTHTHTLTHSCISSLSTLTSYIYNIYFWFFYWAFLHSKTFLNKCFFCWITCDHWQPHPNPTKGVFFSVVHW